MAASRTIVFDVNETLTDQSVFTDRFQAVGAPGLLAQTWYSATLRDGFALTMAGAAAPYRVVARAVLIGLLSGVEHLRLDDRSVDLDQAADHIMAGFEVINPQPDVVTGLRALARSGHRLITLSNGAAGVAHTMLQRHGVDDCVSQVLSVEDAGAWKPDPRSYAYASRSTATPASDLLMVAVHPWDIDGAARSGLQTAFLDRTGAPWPSFFQRPDLHIRSLPELEEQLR